MPMPMVTPQADEEGIAPLVKVWNYDKVDRGGAPQLMRTIRVTRNRPVPVSAVAASEDLNNIAVGLYDGSVYVNFDIIFLRPFLTLFPSAIPPAAPCDVPY